MKASPLLRELIADSDGANSASLKQFPGGFLATAFVFSGQLARRAIDPRLARRRDGPLGALRRQGGVAAVAGAQTAGDLSRPLGDHCLDPPC